ncbi:hypothetical protein ACJX0J_031712, partial [Zea mays]
GNYKRSVVHAQNNNIYSHFLRACLFNLITLDKKKKIRELIQRLIVSRYQFSQGKKSVEIDEGHFSTIIFNNKIETSHDINIFQSTNRLSLIAGRKEKEMGIQK